MPLVHTSLMSFISILVCNIHFKLKFVQARNLDLCLQFFLLPLAASPQIASQCTSYNVKKKKKGERKGKERREKGREGNQKPSLAPDDSSFSILQSSYHHLAHATSISCLHHHNSLLTTPCLTLDPFQAILHDESWDNSSFKLENSFVRYI